MKESVEITQVGGASTQARSDRIGSINGIPTSTPPSTRWHRLGTSRSDRLFSADGIRCAPATQLARAFVRIRPAPAISIPMTVTTMVSPLTISAPQMGIGPILAPQLERPTRTCHGSAINASGTAPCMGRDAGSQAQWSSSGKGLLDSSPFGPSRVTSGPASSMTGRSLETCLRDPSREPLPRHPCLQRSGASRRVWFPTNLEAERWAGSTGCLNEAWICPTPASATETTLLAGAEEQVPEDDAAMVGERAGGGISFVAIRRSSIRCGLAPCPKRMYRPRLPISYRSRRVEGPEITMSQNPGEEGADVEV